MFSLQLQFKSQVEESSKITNCRFEICCEGRNEHNFFSFFFCVCSPSFRSFWADPSGADLCLGQRHAHPEHRHGGGGSGS